MCTALVAAFGTAPSVFAQAPPPAARSVLTLDLSQAAAGAAQDAANRQDPGRTGSARELSADEAVRLAIENNLGIRIARLDPQIEDLNVLGARTNWAPAFTTLLQTNAAESPNQNFLAGAQGLRTNTDQFLGNVGLQQALPWGGQYQVGWDSSRLNTNSGFQTFAPQLRSSLALDYRQPLLRGLGIDNTRQQLLVSTKNREIADVNLRQTLATTERAVRNAYWDLAYALASLQVQQESYDLAEESLRNTRSRVEIGTTPPIDIVEAEAEVARRREAVIVAQGQIGDAEDALRTLVFDPAMPDFWTIRIEPIDAPRFAPISVDTEAAVRNALASRTDLDVTRKNLEVNDVNIRFFRNQTLPDVVASVNYGLQGLGGTMLIRSPGPFGPGTGDVTGQLDRSYGTVLNELFANEYPSWSAALNISYPIGTSTAQANLARVRLQQSQSLAQLRNQELQVTTQVRLAARNVLTSQQRVESSRSARQLAERRLEAEQRKFEAGTSTSFLVFQAQRDLSQARNSELLNILDFNRSIVDLETVQEVPLR